jgi:hypothetical protein
MSKFAVKRTCDECPWRKDVPTGRFPPERYRALAHSCEQGFSRPVFACHKTEGREKACAGFLLVEGFNNFIVRMAASAGRFDPNEITAAAPLYRSFRAMARANGYRMPPKRRW